MSNFSSRVSTSSTFRVPTSRPKVFNATLPHLSIARNHSRRLSREQNALSRSRDNLGRPSREQNAPSRSRDDLGRPFREQNAPFRSRDALADLFVSRSRRLAHETSLADPSVSRMRLFTHETASELSCATGTLQELYRNSTGTLRALLNAAEVRPEPVRLIERLGAFRDGDLDG